MPSVTQQSDAHEAKKFTWDENNLEKNKEVQAQFNCKRINEPKTPYVAYFMPDEEEEEDDGDDHHPHAETLSSPSLQDDLEMSDEGTVR